MRTDVTVRTGIGGSDAAAAVGLSRYKSKLRLYLEKIGEIEPEPDNEAMYWGRKLEPVVVEAFEEKTNKKTRNVFKTLVHPRYPFMIAHIDRKIVGEEALLEVKTTASWNEKEWYEDNVPQEYILQVQHYLAVTGYEKAYLAVLIGGRKLLIKEIVRDEELIDLLIEGEQKFWWHVENKVPPELDSSPDADLILNKMYPQAVNGSYIELPAYENLVEEIQQLSRQIKQLEELKQEKENKIKQAIGEYETAKIGRFTVSWKNVSQVRLDTKALQEQLPDVYKQFCKEITYRRFTIKEG